MISQNEYYLFDGGRGNILIIHPGRTPAKPKVEKTLSDDSDSNWSLPLIVSLGVVGGLFVIIVVVFACYSVRRMVKKKYIGKFGIFKNICFSYFY